MSGVIMRNGRGHSSGAVKGEYKSVTNTSPDITKYTALSLPALYLKPLYYKQQNIDKQLCNVTMEIHLKTAAQVGSFYHCYAVKLSLQLTGLKQNMKYIIATVILFSSFLYPVLSTLATLAVESN